MLGQSELQSNLYKVSATIFQSNSLFRKVSPSELAKSGQLAKLASMFIFSL